MGSFSGNKEFLYKICILGDAGVGKTTILGRILGKEFDTTYKSTIGSEIVVHSFDIDGSILKFQIWDIAGQSHFRFLRTIFYKGTDAAMLVFDKTLPKTFRNLKLWKNELHENLKHDIPIIILGNKADSINDSQLDENTSFIIIDLLKNQLNIDAAPFYYTSALTGMNIKEVFIELGRLILRNDSTKLLKQMMLEK